MAKIASALWLESQLASPLGSSVKTPKYQSISCTSVGTLR